MTRNQGYTIHVCTSASQGQRHRAHRRNPPGTESPQSRLATKTKVTANGAVLPLIQEVQGSGTDQPQNTNPLHCSNTRSILVKPPKPNKKVCSPTNHIKIAADEPEHSNHSLRPNSQPHQHNIPHQHDQTHRIFCRGQKRSDDTQQHYCGGGTSMNTHLNPTTPCRYPSCPTPQTLKDCAVYSGSTAVASREMTAATKRIPAVPQPNPSPAPGRRTS